MAGGGGSRKGEGEIGRMGGDAGAVKELDMGLKE